MQKLMYRVVSLMIASIFYFRTPEKIASLMMAAFLVLWMLWVFEGHAERELARQKKRGGRCPRRRKVGTK